MYPQAYAATFTIYEKVKDSYQVNIVDIGGFTVDCLQLTDFRPDMDFCDSIPYGVNLLFDLSSTEKVNRNSLRTVL